MRSRKVTAKLIVAVVAVVITTMTPSVRAQSAAPSPDDVTDEAELAGIRETVVRYQVTQQIPKDLPQSAQANVPSYCLALNKTVDPDAALLKALDDIRPRVLAYSVCLAEGFSHRIPLWVISVSRIVTGGIQVRGRAAQNGYLYVVVRGPRGWTVSSAHLTGRASPAVTSSGGPPRTVAGFRKTRLPAIASRCYRNECFVSWRCS
jgi:hypothetical protein